MPTSFTCPHCNKTTEVAEQYAGQTGPCGSCGEQITIPQSTSAPTVAPPPPSGPPSSGSSTAMPIVLAVLGVGCVIAVPVIGILVAMLLPAVQAARGAAQRTQCANNLKQISIAMMNYEATHGSFPPAYIPDEDGNPMHSWRVLILPFIEQNFLYEQYDFSVPWDHPNNLALAGQMPMVYRCPGGSNVGSQETSYLVLTGAGTMFEDGNTPRIADIRDGTANTIMLVESGDEVVNWMEPVDFDAADLGLSVNNHPGGFNVALVDCSIHFISDTTDPQTLQAMSTHDGGEMVMPP